MQNRELSRKMRKDMTFEMSFEGHIVFQVDDQRKDILEKENNWNKRRGKKGSGGGD